MKSPRELLAGLNEFSHRVHEVTRRKGFYANPDGVSDLAEKHDNVGEQVRHTEAVGDMIVCQRVALTMVEIGRLVSSLRAGNLPSENLPEPLTAFEDALAATFLRLLDLAGWLRIDLEEAVTARLEYEAGRDYKNGGRRF